MFFADPAMTAAMANPAEPKVSAVLTVYNKAGPLPATMRSLRRQMPDERLIEYVFVDDRSSDRSLDVIREAMAGAPHLRIIENTENRGPSIRLNQGAEAARGQWLYLLDADDIAPAGTIEAMLDLLERERAEVIYGRTEKSLEPAEALLDRAVEAGAPYHVAEAPLRYIMKGGFVRMGLACSRDLFLRAGGADPRIFIQDESLPLRLAGHARRLIDWTAVVLLMPDPGAGASRISSDKTQLHHDAFLAFAHALEDLGPAHPKVAPVLYARAVSAFWKYAMRKSGHPLLQPAFWRYLEAKLLHPAPRPEVLAAMAAELRRLPGIRRP
jgi:glycosyltransferase involved in cell wall biosynthesis